MSMNVDKYSAVELSEYNGTYSIVLGYFDRTGKFMPKWCKQEFGKGNEKNVPVKVPIGQKEKAREILLGLLKELDGEDAPF